MTHSQIDEKKPTSKTEETKLDAETVATKANLIMAACELDSLTDGPGVVR